MAAKVYITGMGIISCIGDNVDQTFEALRNEKTGIGPIKHLQTQHQQNFVVGEIQHSNAALAALANSELHNRTTLLSIIAAKEALANAGIIDTQELRTGLISSTTVAGMPVTELIYKDFLNNKYQGDAINSHFCGAGTNVLADTLNIHEYVNTISTACSSAANAIMLGARLIRNNVLDRVVCGGTDALTIFTLNGFNSLMILDKDWCKPFSQQRKGLNLGEGAAYIVLESEAVVNRSGKKTLATLSGYGNANDSFHQTASSPNGEGATLAMNKALQVAGLNPKDIGYINAHGTGTPNNDASESAAMTNVFGANMPAYSSTKAYTGHTLATAASIEAVISLLSLQHGLIFPTLNHDLAMEDFAHLPVTKVKSVNGLQHVMSNSFGFGGNCSSLIFSAS